MHVLLLLNIQVEEFHAELKHEKKRKIGGGKNVCGDQHKTEKDV